MERSKEEKEQRDGLIKREENKRESRMVQWVQGRRAGAVEEARMD